MISCLYPDCQLSADGDTEAAKRLIVAHTNNEHADAHVLIACKHELRHVEDFNIVVNPQDGRSGYEEANRRYQCVRCGDFVVDVVPEAAEKIIE